MRPARIAGSIAAASTTPRKPAVVNKSVTGSAGWISYDRLSSARDSRRAEVFRVMVERASPSFFWLPPVRPVSRPCHRAVDTHVSQGLTAHV